MGARGEVVDPTGPERCRGIRIGCPDDGNPAGDYIPPFTPRTIAHRAQEEVSGPAIVTRLFAGCQEAMYRGMDA